MTQGEINARLERLIDAPLEEKLEFWNTLTPEQQRRGRHHTDTVKAIRAHHIRYKK